MTREEHIARAMLMSMQFNSFAGYYFDPKRRSSFGRAYYRIDAETLEEISADEASRRRNYRVPDDQ